jgi:hypothetical protein
MLRFKIVLLFAILLVLSHALLLHSTSSSSPSAQNVTVINDVRVSTAGDPDPRNETSIAVSATNPLVIAGASKVILGGAAGAGATRVSYYSSSDGGLTWATALLPLATPEKTFSRASDPSVVANLDGEFYLCALMLDNSSFDNGVYVFKSIDGGRTFSNPLPAFLDLANPNPRLSDKCYLTIDSSPTSPFKNTVYVVWTLNAGGQTVIQMSRLRPGDAAFSAPRTISHEGDMRGPSVVTGPNGELYAAWEGIGNPRVLLFNASTDGGNTFLPTDVAPSIDVNIHSFTGSLSQPGATVSINGVSRMNSFPVIDVDRSNGANRGRIYVAWAESTNRFDADVFVKSMPPPNGGRPEVGPPVKVNNDGPGADQFFPWLSVDANNGSVCVAFYDRRDDLGALLNMYLARSTDGGGSFTENTRVSTAGTDPRIQASVTGTTGTAIGIGDYVGLTATRGRAHLLWADTRNSKQEIFYGQVEYASSGGGDPIGPANDACGTARIIGSLPFLEESDTRAATGVETDPISCSGSRDSHSVWYSITAAADTVYGLDTASSDYDTVASVYTGSCGGLTRVACSDDFGNRIGSPTRSMLTFSARAGVTYLIEVSGKGSGGTLRLRIGLPTAVDVGFKKAPDGSKALKISGAGFVDGNARVSIRIGDTETELPTLFFLDRQADGTAATMYATRNKLKKLVKAGTTVLVSIESTSGSNSFAVPFFFTR